jgi:D-glycero-alpha-D-manno-heptose-7-phosphate kinase
MMESNNTSKRHCQVAPREKQNAVFEAMKDFREMPFMFERGGSKVIFDDRRYSSK